jgi:hypothetical protein
VNAIQKTFQNLPKPRFYLDESRIRTKEQAEAPGEVRLWRIRILPGDHKNKKRYGWLTMPSFYGNLLLVNWAIISLTFFTFGISLVGKYL